MRKLLLLALVASAPVPLAAQYQVDTTGAGALIAQAMDRSEVMQNLQYLSDAIGPRLSGSPAMRASNEWVAERFRAYGLTASLEAFPFGVTWERGPIRVQLTSPFRRALLAYSWAWTEGTGGQALALLCFWTLLGWRWNGQRWKRSPTLARSTYGIFSRLPAYIDKLPGISKPLTKRSAAH